MSTLFGNLSNDGLEESQDRLGGYQPRNSNIYEFVVKAMFAGVSDGGARSVTFIGEEGGKEYRETFWVTNKNGENWFPAKDKQGKPTGKKSPLPGFTMVDDICLITTGKGLAEQDAEDKVVKVWEDGKEVNKAMPHLVDVAGQKVALGVLRRLVNKNVKNDAGVYVPGPEEREENVTDKVFHPELKLTCAEARNEATEPVFWDAWLNLNKDKVKDGRKYDAKTGGTAGGPPQSSKSGAPAAGGAPAGERKSLFGKK
ncbi:hypothetical protein [Caballeronia sp. TF1N1]|uniref:hypothetical protein n=1 Tax=Caballeronia sp. TF1N1 TaxID=2878153 RepID=UPI001FD2EB9A|nr:hypothetical protein [Caballeronia sp. TF1N1]